MAEVLYEGCSAEELRRALDLPRVWLEDCTPSTMDTAHRLAAGGTPAGTLVLADSQTSGRGRGGTRWVSEAGKGIWLTLVERPGEATRVTVLSIRSGLRCARALDLFADEPVRLKWPNDLYVGAGKLAGLLIEVRWRGDTPDYTAMGLGINVAPPSGFSAAALEPGTSRLEVLGAVVPELRSAASARGELTAREIAEFGTRDLARGRRCVQPATGVVEGISSAGELLIGLADSVARFNSGSLVLEP